MSGRGMPRSTYANGTGSSSGRETDGQEAATSASTRRRSCAPRSLAGHWTTPAMRSLSSNSRARRLDALITVRTWVEVREVFLPGQAATVNRFVREYNGIRGKGTIDGSEFLRSLDLGVPGARIQREMAGKVVRAVMKKAGKGDVGGSYRPLVNDYGRGVLIVGLPLWFAAWPQTLKEPTALIDEFAPRVLLGFQAIERNVLRQPWCPFDSVGRDLEPDAGID